MESDATSAEDFVPSLLVFSKFLKLLTQKVTGTPWQSVSGQMRLLSFRSSAEKKGLTAFQRRQLGEGFDAILLETTSDKIARYGCCAESTPLLSNFVM